MDKLEELLTKFLTDLRKILLGVSETVATQEKTALNKDIFFDEVRGGLSALVELHPIAI